MINKTLAILAGGKSSRMNYNNKGFLIYKEDNFIQHIINAGENYKEIIILANDKKLYEKFNLRIVEDIYPGHGPISGIHSALKNSTTESVLCVACDMPLISKEVLDTLGNYSGDYEVLIPKIKSRMQPLCSIYSKRIINKLEECIMKDENKLQKLIFDLNYKVIKNLDERAFFNINTPEDYRNLEEK